LLCGGAGVHERQLCHAASCLSRRANLEWLGLRLHCRRPMWLDLLRRRNRLHGWELCRAAANLPRRPGMDRRGLRMHLGAHVRFDLLCRRDDVLVW
jgi:hypothetical protein